MEVGESANVVLAKSAQKKTWSFRAEVVEVTFPTTLKVARKRTKVDAPHWKKGVDVKDVWDEAKVMHLPEDSSYSQRAAALLVRGAAGATQDVEVKVHVLEAENVSGTGALLGSLGDLKIRGQCPLNTGEHVVKAQIEELPEEISWVRGEIAWELNVPDPGADIALNGTPVEVFFLLAPCLLEAFKPTGVWVEALRFLCAKVGVTNLKTPEEVAAKITRYCHGSHGLKYDTVAGKPRYWNSGTLEFALSNYLIRATTRCNCYDQASAVQVFSGAIGIALEWIYMKPYGFIKLTLLVGVGNCNNPFYKNSMYRKKKHVKKKHTKTGDERRSAFDNHAFCRGNNLIMDACAGPHVGTETLKEYIDASIDTDPRPYALYNKRFSALPTPHEDLRPGTVADAQNWSDTAVTTLT